MKCNKCGYENKENAKFCAKCGSSLESTVKIIKKEPKKDNSTILIVAVTAIILIVIGLVTCYGLGVFDGGAQDQVSQSESGPTVIGDSKAPKESGKASTVSLSSFPVSDAPELAAQIGRTGDADNVNFKGVTLTKAQVCYILTKSVSLIGSGGESQTIDVRNFAYASSPQGANVPQTISSSQYLDMCNRFSSWMDRNGQVPNYVGINTGGVPDVSPTNMINICVKILVDYKNTGRLPSTAVV